MKIHNIAPPALIRTDWNLLVPSETLAVNEDVARLLFIQSIEGRAHNGAGSFLKRRYVNTTIEDIVEALNLDSMKIRKDRQLLIDEIEDFAKNICSDNDRVLLVNRQGKPLLGLKILTDQFFNSRDIIKGLILGGFRDNPEARHSTEDAYNIKIGHGRLYTVDIDVMEQMGLDAEILAHEEHGGEIQEFRKQGLIVDVDAGTDLQKFRYMYIRDEIGPGASDDSAFIASAVLYGLDVAMGVFLSDAIDTLEKYAVEFRDRDGELARELQEMFPCIAPTEEQMQELIFISAIPEGMEEEVPDSSLRYLLMIDQPTGECALQNHIRFVESTPYHSMLLGFGRIPSYRFYGYIRERLLKIKKPIPTLKPITLR
jgi:hypothetical protein